MDTVNNLHMQQQGLSFASTLTDRAHAVRSWLCIGLDPDLSALPPSLPRTPGGVEEFCRRIVDATHHIAAAFKPNAAFFEALGPDGWDVLWRVREAIPNEIPVILDAKRGDLGNTARAYARAVFEAMQFDAVTVNPYLGADSLEPFLGYPGRGIFVLCKTSNPGAADLQDLLVHGEPLYMHVARMALALEGGTDVGLVVGATQPDAVQRVRQLSDDAVFLMPGVGRQGATARASVRLGANGMGDGALINVSRDILYASSGEDFADAARKAAEGFAADAWIDR